MGEYLQQCIDTASVIDVDKVAQMAIGEPIAWDNNFQLTQQGALPTTSPNALEVYGALKLPSAPDRKEAVWIRLAREIAITDFLTDRSLMQTSQFRRFVCMIQVEDGTEENGTRCLLTEDVSAGGTRHVKRRPTSDDARREIIRAFSDYEKPETRISNKNLESSLAFDVDGTEMFLGLEPGPIKPKLYDDVKSKKPFRTYYHAVRDVRSNLTLPIPLETPLGSALTRRAKSLKSR